MALEDVEKRNKIVPVWLRAIIVSIFLALVVYQIYYKTGLYGWMRGLQLDWWDEYYPVPTGLITTIITILPGAVLTQLLVRVFEGRRDERNRPG